VVSLLADNCDRMAECRATRTEGKLPKLHSSWEVSYKTITQIKDVVYRIQMNPRLRITTTWVHSACNRNKNQKQKNKVSGE
jgi:hypothetical protein